MSEVAKRIYNSVRRIYRPSYAALNVATAVAYYLFFGFLIRYQDYGIFLVNVPAYLEYAVIITASVLLTISVYSIRNTRRNKAKFTASSVSAVTLILGGVLGGCGCAEPLLMGFAALGISSTTLFSLNSLISSFSVQVFFAMAAVNIAIIVYYLNKLSKQSCIVKPKKSK